MFHTERNNRDETPGVGVVQQKAPEKRIKKVILEKKRSDYFDLNIMKFILIDSQSTMDLLCNEDMLEMIYKEVIDHKVVVSVFIKDVWFDKTAINNIFALKNLIQKYKVTYDILDQIFIVQREENNKLNMQFRMHVYTIYGNYPFFITAKWW